MGRQFFTPDMRERLAGLLARHMTWAEVAREIGHDKPQSLAWGAAVYGLKLTAEGRSRAAKIGRENAVKRVQRARAQKRGPNPLAQNFGRADAPLQAATAAAQFLGRWHRPCYSLTVTHGRAGEGRYLMGRRVVTVAELLDEARRRGWAA